MYFQHIKDLRNDADKTQKQIAEILHTSISTYQNYEYGTSEIPSWAVIQLAQYYDVSSDYLLGLSKKKSPYPKD